jgi:hypothetical protein
MPDWAVWYVSYPTFLTLLYTVVCSADTVQLSFGRLYLSHLPIFRRTILASSNQNAYTLQNYWSSPQPQIKGFNTANNNGDLYLSHDPTIKKTLHFVHTAHGRRIIIRINTGLIGWLYLRSFSAFCPATAGFLYGTLMNVVLQSVELHDLRHKVILQYQQRSPECSRRIPKPQILDSASWGFLLPGTG